MATNEDLISVVKMGLSQIGLDDFVKLNYDGIKMETMINIETSNNSPEDFNYIERINRLRARIADYYRSHRHIHDQSGFPEPFDNKSKAYAFLDLALLGYKLHLCDTNEPSDIINQVRKRTLEDIRSQSIKLGVLIWDRKFKRALYSLSLSASSNEYSFNPEYR
jgi:hypothetical protein